MRTYRHTTAEGKTIRVTIPGANEETHTKDEDCDVDPMTGCCRTCGVLHGDPCPECGGRGFHTPGCSESDVAEF
jgi:hypothetical protein